MKIQIENTPHRFFNEKEEYLTFKSNWGIIMSDKETRKQLKNIHHFIYNLICGKDLTRCYTLITNRKKLENGAVINHGLYEARLLLGKLAQSAKEVSNPRPNTNTMWGGKSRKSGLAIMWDNSQKYLDEILTPFTNSIFVKPLYEIIIELDEILPKFPWLSNTYYFHFMPDKITFDSVWNILSQDTLRKPGFGGSKWFNVSEQTSVEESYKKHMCKLNAEREARIAEREARWNIA